MKNIFTLIIFSLIVSLSFSQTNPLSVYDTIIASNCDSTDFLLINNTPPQSPILYYQWVINGVTHNVGTSQAPFPISVLNTNGPTNTILNAFYNSNFTNSAYGMTHYVFPDTCAAPYGGIFYSQYANGCDSALFNLTTNPSGGVSPYTVAWLIYENGATSSPTIYYGVSLDIFMANGTLVELEITDANLIPYVTSQTVYTSNPSYIYTTTTHTEISSDCNNTVVQLFGNSNDTTVTYEWILDTNTGSDTSYVQNPIFTVSNSSPIVVTQLTVTNNVGCTAIDWYTIFLTGNSQTGYADVSNYSTTPCISGSCDFEIVLHATNGTAPYSYTLDGGAPTTINAFGNLCAGVHVATIEDANGCSMLLDVIVEEVDSLQVYESFYYSNCDSGSTGNNSYINAYASNGTTVWSNGFTGYSISNPTPGTYSYIITDNTTGCTASGTFIVPSNNCYTISGNVYADLDGDCIFNNNDYAISNVWVDLTNASGTWLWIYDYADANGYYSINAPAGTYYFDVNGNNVTNYTQTCPIGGYSVTVGPSNPNAVVDFFMMPPAPVQDLSVSLFSFTTFTPGFPYWAYATYCNDGTIPMSGTVVMNYDAGLTYVAGSSSGATNDAVNNTLTWSFTNLNPGQCQSLWPDFVCSTTAVLGTTMSNTIVVNPISGDITPNNNTAYIIDTVVGSWDPNDKAVYPQAGMLQSEKDHDYTIRFQNKGNYHATFVIVRDDLDDNLDLQTLRNVSASHSFVMTVENTDELVFTFNNIMLPAEQDDEPGSHGSIHYTISQKEDLPLGTVIENTAFIYFDYNEAVVTNTTQNTIVEKATGIQTLSNNAQVIVYPNPTNGFINIEADSKIKAIQVFNVIGKEIFKADDLNSSKAFLNIADQADGIYIVKIETEKGIVIEKVTISNKK